MALTVVALWAFTRPYIPLEFSSLGLIAILALGAAVFPYPGLEPTSFFAGFGHEALIAVCALMVLGQGLVKTGALEPVGRWLARSWNTAPFLSLLATLIIGAVFSAFVNNTPIVVLLLPILVSVCIRTNRSPSGILMPMGFATLVGGMATTIGTSTNLLVVSVAADLGLPRIGMFDFALPAAAGAGVAIIYLWLIAPRMLPHRDIGISSVSPRLFEARLQIRKDSPVIGKKLGDAIAMTDGEMKVVRIRRGGTFILPLPDVELKAGDRLRVRDTPVRLKSYEDTLKAVLYSGETRVDEEHPLQAENQMLAEIAVVQGSTLDRANLSFTRFLDRYQLVVLALHRAGKDIWRASEEIQDVILQNGDVLLVQGRREQIASLRENSEFLVLDGGVELPTTSRAPLALGILMSVILVAAFGIVPIAIAALAGGFLLLVTRCLPLVEAMRAISTSVYFVVVASLALGHALITTGATAYITEVFLALTSNAGPTIVLGSLMMLLAVLTNVVSNNAAAVIGTPIAVGIAQELNLPTEPFVLAVLFGANMSFATPFGYQTNLLILSAGGYKFSDFLRVGIPLTILMWLGFSVLLPLLYHLG